MVYSADGTVRVIVGSYDKSSFIRQLLKAGKLENDLLKDKNEKFIITTLHNLLKGLEGESCSLPDVNWEKGTHTLTVCPLALSMVPHKIVVNCGGDEPSHLNLMENPYRRER